MKLRKLAILKLVLVPFPMWVLTLLIFTIPYIFDNYSETYQHIWFVYIIPAFIFSYYWGIWGGMLTAFITIVSQLSHELMAKSGIYNNEEHLLVLVLTSLINCGIAFGIGLLASRLKNKQKIIEKVNDELKQKNKQLDNLSHMDELTGLWNRRGFLKLANVVLQSAKQEQQNLSLLFVDLDKFKPVNDSHGHQVGDKLLQDVAKRLKNIIREEDIIARIGGDEFTILLQNIDEESSIQIANKIIIELSNIFIIDGKEIYITSSIGINFSSSNEHDVESFIQNADIAMFFVKRKGRNSFLLFDKSMKEYTENRIHLENQLRKAIQQEEFFLYYQPQFDVMTKQIVGLEALIRWQSNGKIISPAEFIPVAEETGLILPIGKWVLESACKQVKLWIEAGYPPLPVSINVSSYQFQQHDFVQNIEKVLKETKIEPRLLKLELTESVILGNEKTIVNKLRSLKNLGISLSIDDFGSGYSSLNYLKNFPIDEIKMDKSFIDDIAYNPKERALIQTIIQLGESLETIIVAEGVETKEQLMILKEAGCNIIQGYLIDKPMPAVEIEKRFQNRLVSIPS